MEIDTRISDLEDANRRLHRRLLLTALVLGGIICANSQATPQKTTQENVVRAERFEVVNSKGEIKATFGIMHGADWLEGVPPTVEMGPGKEVTTGDRVVLAEVAELNFWNGEDPKTIRASIAATGISITHPDNASALVARMSKFGPFIVLCDRDGKTSFQAPTKFVVPTGKNNGTGKKSK